MIKRRALTKLAVIDALKAVNEAFPVGNGRSECDQMKALRRVYDERITTWEILHSTCCHGDIVGQAWHEATKGHQRFLPDPGIEYINASIDLLGC